MEQKVLQFRAKKSELPESTGKPESKGTIDVAWLETSLQEMEEYYFQKRFLLRLAVKHAKQVLNQMGDVVEEFSLVPDSAKDFSEAEWVLDNDQKNEMMYGPAFCKEDICDKYILHSVFCKKCMTDEIYVMHVFLKYDEEDNEFVFDFEHNTWCKTAKTESF